MVVLLRPAAGGGARRGGVVPTERWFWFLGEQDAQGIALPVTLLFALLVRWCVALHGYSGRGMSPLYGDYEAQRHWMELTVHVAPSEWYFYDLAYWGLDYPPLTAFQSWVCGRVAHLIDPSWVALGQSRGIETPASKLFMRSTVLVLEALIYVPAVVLLFRSRQMPMNWIARETSIFSVLLQPCLIMIDHGHFQYNSVMLGFLVWSVYFAARERYLLMAVCFCLSLMFKQMALYFAPAVFAFLLAKCFRSPYGVQLFVKLGLVVIGTFGIMLLPWMGSSAQLHQILIRVFPVARGLYEDKVANVWCAVNAVAKLRVMFGTSALVRLAAGATTLAFLPSCVHLFRAVKRSAVGQALLPADAVKLLCYGLVNTSLAFFLFSFQVHEKSILLPLAPVLLLIHEEPWAVNWFVQVALFSLYPLLFRDGLQAPYWVMAIGWSLLRSCPACPADKKTPLPVLNAQWLTMLAMVALHAAQALIPPPPSLPDLYVVLNVMFSCSMFVIFFAYFNYRQLTLPLVRARTARSRTKKDN
ncbi:Glucosyltransferase-like protein [Coemansia thaxteri]|uniref:Alpha-1,3-glucosyltransferase n=1 Tax=Coemansia thaxteri TaxID=2663907 RepID=A0A9W8EEQ6_9FUNG|nr:Glucosyltransferase-like protein [Coemansia thaxteri]KAJ2007753.1 Glucosyltransferase-like protein [Coemansia thaxteri]KAJ2472813.1 Glucosyltransferase-like protein [Coemansia sp. RSA 2322]KAJ2481458.1 Glucosyltransferase-like protein [Coemansia sp. RSA 2320]